MTILIMMMMMMMMMLIMIRMIMMIVMIMMVMMIFMITMIMLIYLGNEEFMIMLKVAKCDIPSFLGLRFPSIYAGLVRPLLTEIQRRAAKGIY